MGHPPETAESEEEEPETEEHPPETAAPGEE
jgi:hypothetical protein